MRRNPIAIEQGFEPLAFMSCFHGWCDWELLEKKFVDPREVRLDTRKKMGMLGDMVTIIGRPINLSPEIRETFKNKKQKQKQKQQQSKSKSKDIIRESLRSEWLKSRGIKPQAEISDTPLELFRTRSNTSMANIPFNKISKSVSNTNTNDSTQESKETEQESPEVINEESGFDSLENSPDAFDRRPQLAIFPLGLRSNSVNIDEENADNDKCQDYMTPNNKQSILLKKYSSSDIFDSNSPNDDNNDNDVVAAEETSKILNSNNTKIKNIPSPKYSTSIKDAKRTTSYNVLKDNGMKNSVSPSSRKSIHVTKVTSPPIKSMRERNSLPSSTAKNDILTGKIQSNSVASITKSNNTANTTNHIVNVQKSPSNATATTSMRRRSMSSFDIKNEPNNSSLRVQRASTSRMTVPKTSPNNNATSETRQSYGISSSRTVTTRTKSPSIARGLSLGESNKEDKRQLINRPATAKVATVQSPGLPKILF
jgi:hypothetical protein